VPGSQAAQSAPDVTVISLNTAPAAAHHDVSAERDEAIRNEKQHHAESENNNVEKYMHDRRAV